MIPRIRLVQIKNYKSLTNLSVELEPFNVFVGPNGSGKSNFIDALAFVQECLTEPMEVVLNKRGGMSQVMSRLERREPIKFPKEPMTDEGMQEFLDRSICDAAHMAFRLVVDLADGLEADYAFEIVWREWNSFFLSRERCVVREASGVKHEYEIRNGRFVKEIPGIRMNLVPDRLALPLIAGAEEFAPLWGFLASMRFYCIDPVKLRHPQPPDPGSYLKEDGSNSAAILKNLFKFSSGSHQLDLFTGCMENVVEGIEGVAGGPYGHQQTIWFRQDLGLQEPVDFTALNMSDGTLRALGVLLAVCQPAILSVVGIEEPEATIHPALADMIMEVLIDASNDKQVLITSHSPDLLDYKELRENQIKVVKWHRGTTSIAPVSLEDRTAIQEHLYTPGELLSVDELSPDPVQIERSSRDIDLFGVPFATDGQQQ